MRDSISVDMHSDNSLLGSIVHDLSHLTPVSRDDMKLQIRGLLEKHEVQETDTHNTANVMYVFKLDEVKYGLKIEYGLETVMDDEIHWYRKALADMKSHYVASVKAKKVTFLILRWLESAQTVEQIALEEDNPKDIVDIYKRVLDQDANMFRSFDTKSLEATSRSGFFYDKFYTKLEQASKFRYLYDLLRRDEVMVNGRILPGPERLINYVQNDERLRDYLSPKEAGFIHGDIHAGNVLVAGEDIYLVDGNGLDYLPLEYDYGRVIWSFTGWNAICRHTHSLVEKDNAYELSVLAAVKYTRGIARLKDYFDNLDKSVGLELGRSFHKAVYSSAMQYMSRADHAAVENEATALHLQGLILMIDLLEGLGHSADKILSSQLGYNKVS